LQALVVCEPGLNLRPASAAFCNMRQRVSGNLPESKYGLRQRKTGNPGVIANFLGWSC